MICSVGYRSQDVWRIKCRPNNKWSHEAFSPCITCTDIDLSDPSIISHVTYRKNLPLIQIDRSDSIFKLIVGNFAFKSSQKVTKLRCACRKHTEKGSRRQRKCGWRTRGLIPLEITEILDKIYEEPKLSMIFQMMKALATDDLPLTDQIKRSELEPQAPPLKEVLLDRNRMFDFTLQQLKILVLSLKSFSLKS